MVGDLFYVYMNAFLLLFFGFEQLKISINLVT